MQLCNWTISHCLLLQTFSGQETIQFKMQLFRIRVVDIVLIDAFLYENELGLVGFSDLFLNY